VPQITKVLQDVDAIKGSSSEFVCEVSHAEAHTRWFVNNQEVFDGEKYKLDIQGNSRKLTIRNCTKQDAGCIRAMVGEQKSEAEFIVKGIVLTVMYFNILSMISMP
jgi:hypothetical protein